MSDNNTSQLPEITIYTDGACSPNPGPGGWGAVFLRDNKVIRELSGYGGNTTNNRMELSGVISALKSLDHGSRVTIYTDSQYVKNGITVWISAWQKNNWQTAARKPVKNVDLWQELQSEIERHQISWKWVRGHAANKWNERADELAVLARKEQHQATVESVPQQRINKDCISLYTGVTCKHSTGVGAWAVILCWRHHVKILGARVEGMTANQLYLKAAIAGLSSLTKDFPIEIHTHSGYLRDGAVSWLPGWQKRNWLTREGTPVSNLELWQELAALLKTSDVTFHLDNRDEPLCFMQEAKELAREYEQE